MTEYKENVWYGWNGGECPVHPRTVVEIATSGKRGGTGEDYASEFKWDGSDYLGNPIVAFRVVKEYRQPREWWAAIYNHTGDIGSPYKTEAEAVASLSGYPNARVVLFCEVTEDDA